MNLINTSEGKPVKIGIFDSGVGGLTVLSKLFQNLAFCCDFTYLADNAHLPYGDKTQAQIQSFFEHSMRWFTGQNVDAVAIACNTSDACVSDSMIEQYSKYFNYGIVRLIKPAMRQLIAKNHPKNVVVMATNLTVKIHAYASAIEQFTAENPGERINVIEVACPDLVPFIEQNDFDFDGVRDIILRYIGRYVDTMDCLVLGCTHYPLLAQYIAKILPKNVIIYNPADATLNSINALVNRNDNVVQHSLKFYATAASKAGSMQSFAGHVLGYNPEILDAAMW